MEVLTEILQTFLAIISMPILLLLSPILHSFKDPELGGAIICAIASVIYVILCFLATVIGWRYEDITSHCSRVRVWSLSGGWRFLHVIAKFLLLALHVAIYWAIWHGEAFGLSETPHPMADILCGGMTTAGLILSAWIVYKTNIHDAEYGPTYYG